MLGYVFALLSVSSHAYQRHNLHGFKIHSPTLTANTIKGHGNHQTRLQMSEEQSLLDQMRKALGETEDVFADAERESKQLMQGISTFI
jgi:hypothetical protein